MNPRYAGLLAIAAAALILAGLPPATAQPPPTSDEAPRVHLPMVLWSAAREDFPRPPTSAATATATEPATAPPPATPTDPVTEPPPPTATDPATETAPPPTETGEPSETPTDTPPPPSDTPEPTPATATGTIRGRYLENGAPLSAGYGADGLPQIELQRCAAGQCDAVARTITQEGGTFTFENPPALAPGEVYQVVWRNEPGLSFDGFLHRWWSRRITAFGAGEMVDLGAMEIGNLELKEICHDCGQTLPITFKWTARQPRTEVYRWSLFRACGDYSERPNAYRTESLGHVGQYTLNAPPRGFRLDEKYCWFIQIEDPQRGTGWSYYDWRVTFLSGQ